MPRGRVTTYGAVAELVGSGGPRQVGAVMARYGGPVPWWRVVRADGSLPPSHQGEARQAYLEEGTPMRPSGAVDIVAAVLAARVECPRRQAECGDRCVVVGLHTDRRSDLRVQHGAVAVHDDDRAGQQRRPPLARRPS